METFENLRKICGNLQEMVGSLLKLADDTLLTCPIHSRQVIQCTCTS